MIVQADAWTKGSTHLNTAVGTGMHTEAGTAQKAEKPEPDAALQEYETRSPIFEADSLDGRSQKEDEPKDLKVEIKQFPEQLEQDPVEMLRKPVHTRAKNVREEALNQEISELVSMQHSMTTS